MYEVRIYPRKDVAGVYKILTVPIWSKNEAMFFAKYLLSKLSEHYDCSKIIWNERISEVVDQTYFVEPQP